MWCSAEGASEFEYDHNAPQFSLLLLSSDISDVNVISKGLESCSKGLWLMWSAACLHTYTKHKGRPWSFAKGTLPSTPEPTSMSSDTSHFVHPRI